MTLPVQQLNTSPRVAWTDTGRHNTHHAAELTNAGERAVFIAACPACGTDATWSLNPTQPGGGITCPVCDPPTPSRGTVPCP